MRRKLRVRRGSAQFKALVPQNAAALRQARVGLRRQCRVPLGYSMSYSSNHIADLREVASQERAWSNRTFGWRGQVLLLVQRGNLQKNAQQALAKLQAQQRAARLMMIELAERAYEVEHGVTPDSISDLVPAYLKAPPRDPVDPSKIMDLPTAPKPGVNVTQCARF